VQKWQLVQLVLVLAQLVLSSEWEKEIDIEGERWQR
jgi:hypothetical protein